MKKIITEIVLVPDSEPHPAIYSEGTITVRLIDEGGGPFLRVQGEDESSPVCLNFSELDALVEACRMLERNAEGVEHVQRDPL